MSEKKPLRCHICHNQAQEEEEERLDMVCCPIHGWMPVQFFEVREGTRIFLKINRKRNPGSD
ncbi:MAG: hypothetical protein ABIB41_01235 [Nitrospirota bacterium]